MGGFSDALGKRGWGSLTCEWPLRGASSSPGKGRREAGAGLGCGISPPLPGAAPASMHIQACKCRIQDTTPSPISSPASWLQLCCSEL